MNSNLSNVVLLGQFNPKTDKWCDYKEQLLCALDVAGVAQDLDRARSLFLSQCGKDTYSLIASLLVPLRPTSASFEDIIRVLDQFFEPEVNEILQAGKFHKRIQLQQESVQEFIGAISLLGAKCNFADLKRQLRDRLVLGVRDDRLRRELLKTKDLTYTGAVQYCLNYQATFADLYPDARASTSKQTPHNESDQMEIDKIQSVNCKHCARVHKPNERCPFSKAQCYYCKRHGHIASACNKRQGKVHMTEEECSCHSNPDQEDMMNGIYVCTEDYCEPIKANVDINGAKLLMEIDSGASRTIISEETFKKLWSSPPPLDVTNVKLVTWNRSPLKVLGLLHVRVVLGDKEAQCELLVVSGRGPSLVGRNWFKKLGLRVDGVGWSEEEIAEWKNKYPDLFKEGLGEYTGPPVSLHVRPGAAPRFMRARPVPFPLKQQVEDELRQMIKDGVLTPINHSKWATPLRIVKKDNGSLRICGDYRATVNASIDVDTYPLPTSTEAFVNLSGGSIFSKLDLKQAYTQLKVDDNTAMLLTLNTPIGLMKVNRLAYGVSAAPGIFQRLMSTTLANMEGVACLLDDVAVTGRNVEEHNQRLNAVLEKLQDMGFRLNVDKCVFASRSITFLGHMLDAEGLHPTPEKVEEIQATLLEPLYRLLEAKSPWTWGDKEQAAFNKAKSLLSSDCTLVGYDLNKELLLVCDSSDYGLGAVLVHTMEDGSERPVMMASRTLQPHERRYGQIDKEALAIMFGLSKYHQFLAGRRFCIITDHKPLVGLFNPEKPIPDQIAPRMLRWSLKLNGYSYSIKYRPGKLIGNADALSRWTQPETFSADPNIDCLGEVLLLEEQPPGWNLDVKTIAQETKKDQMLQKVLFNVLHGWPRSNTDPEMQPYWIRREALSHNKNCLLWCNRVVIPTSLHQRVLKLLHAPHAGIVQTKAYARGYLWWAGMDKEIEKVVAECEDCQSVRNNPPKDPQIWVMPEKPWSRLHIDFAGPFQGKTFLLLIDSYSKWIEAEIVPSMSSDSIITILRRIFASQGLPEVLVSDNGRTFTSEDFNLFLSRNHIKHIFTPPYHPASNGQIERAVQTFKNKLKKMAATNMTWSEKLAKALYALRTVPNSSTNKTPAEMLNGRKYRTAISSLHPESTPSRAEQQLEQAAQRPCARAFSLHQPVLVRMYTPGTKWAKGEVETIEGPSTYVIRTEDGELHRRHADQIIGRAQRHTMTAPACDQQPLEFGSQSSTEEDPYIEIPPPELWPDIIGIPNDY
ncbi:uncharacterized protein K02A2.6-like [Leguminivora glycinivorella]|uniref:uncharacterized protein K02A2.6-like n=1 Tax=Leguminivora glycinivorella TaxID=1035111 RepID=UPI00200CAA9C|nr:uncharacterized protein K02A2.6-like [Leguminivora glycinivorella]